MLPPSTVCVSAPDPNMGKEPWDSRLRVDDEAKQSIDFKDRKWEFPITAKVRTVDECLLLALSLSLSLSLSLCVFDV